MIGPAETWRKPPVSLPVGTGTFRDMRANMEQTSNGSRAAPCRLSITCASSYEPSGPLRYPSSASGISRNGHRQPAWSGLVPFVCPVTWRVPYGSGDVPGIDHTSTGSSWWAGRSRCRQCASPDGSESAAASHCASAADRSASVWATSRSSALLTLLSVERGRARTT